MAAGRPAIADSTSPDAASKGTTSGRILVRRKWSGQEVPARASSSRRFEHTSSSTSGESSKCAIFRSALAISARIAVARRTVDRVALGLRKRGDAWSPKRRRGALGSEPLVGAADHRERVSVALLGRLAPGEKAVAREHDAIDVRSTLRGVAELERQIEARALPG